MDRPYVEYVNEFNLIGRGHVAEYGDSPLGTGDFRLRIVDNAQEARDPDAGRWISGEAVVAFHEGVDVVLAQRLAAILRQRLETFTAARQRARELAASYITAHLDDVLSIGVEIAYSAGEEPAQADAYLAARKALGNALVDLANELNPNEAEFHNSLRRQFDYR